MALGERAERGRDESLLAAPHLSQRRAPLPEAYTRPLFSST